MEGKKPLKKELKWSKIGDVYLLTNEGKTYTIDAVSFLVWIQCDGKTDVEQIVDVFSVNGNRDIVKAAIIGILEKLAKKELITWI